MTSFSPLARLGLFAVICGTVSLAWAGDDAEDLLKKARDRANSQKYAGVRTTTLVTHKGEKKTFTEFVLRDGKRQRIEYPSNSEFAGQTVVESDGERRTYTKATNEIRVSKSLPFTMQFDLGQRGGKIDWEMKDGGRIAGHDTKLVVARIGGEKRFAIWVEPRRSMVLKREVYDRKGDFIGGFSYTRIRFSPEIRDSMFELPKSAKVVGPKDDLMRIAKELGLRPYTIDPRTGYELMFVRKTEFDGKNALRQFYDTGRERVTLVQMKDLEAKGFSSEGRVNTYSWRHRGVTLMLIGELDESAMRRLASGITIQQPE